MAGRVQIVLEVDDKGVTTAFGRTTDAVGKLDPALQKVGVRGNVVMTQLVGQQQQARDGAQLLGFAIGAQLPRELEKVLAKSKLLGPALAGAFNVFVVAAFGTAVLSQLPKIAAFSLAIGGMTAEFKALEEAARRASNAALMGFATPEQGAAIQRTIMKQIEDLRSLADFSALDIFVGTPARRAIDYWFGTDEERAKKIEALSTLSGEIAKRGKELREQELAHAKQTGEKRLAHEKTIADGIQKLWEMQTDARLDAIQKAQEAAAKLAVGVENAVDHAFDVLERRRGEGTEFMQGLASDRFNATASAEDKIRAEYESTFQRLREMEAAGALVHGEFEVGKANASAIAASRMMEIQQRQLQEWQMAVHQMSGIIERFLDNPVQYLKNLWKRFLTEMVASWILSMRSLQGGTGAVGGLLSSLFGMGGGGGGAGFSLPSGSAGGVQLPPGVTTTFPTSGGGGFQFGRFTPGVAGLAGLPFSAGGGVGAGNILPTGASTSTTAKLSAGAQLSAMLPALIAGGGLLGASKIGFGGPGRGALSGALLGFTGALAAVLPFSTGLASLFAAGSAFGPIGLGAAALGALIGALFGMSSRNKQKAQAMDILNSGRAQWKRIISDFESHRMDYGSAIAGVTQVWQQLVQAWSSPSLGKYGGIAIQNNAPEFRRTLQQIEDLQAKRQWTAQSPMFGAAGEFSTGGFVSPSLARPIGPLGISAMPSAYRGLPRFDTGGPVPIIAHAGEFVMQRSAVQRIGRGKLEAMNSTGGARGAGPGLMIQIVAWDGASVDSWLRNGGTGKLERALQRAGRDRGES